MIDSNNKLITYTLYSPSHAIVPHRAVVQIRLTLISNANLLEKSFH